MAIIGIDTFLGLASKIELEYSVSIVHSKSQSGRRSSQRRGPLLYGMSVEFEPARINSDKYYEILEFIQLLNYGDNTVYFGLETATSSGRAITAHRGVWSGTPVVSGADQVGQSITISDGSGGATTGYARAFDYVQFDGSTKVYQINSTLVTSGGISTVSSSSFNTASGSVDLTLNTPLVVAPANSSSVVFGSNVKFHMAMMKVAKVTYLPGDIVEFSEFSFEEVIENI